MIRKRLAQDVNEAQKECHHLHMHYRGAIPNTGPRVCSMCGSTEDEIMQDLGLTYVQYFGGPMTHADTIRVGEVLLERLGDYRCEAPDVCSAQWGYHAWVKWIDRSTFGGL